MKIEFLKSYNSREHFIRAIGNTCPICNECYEETFSTIYCQSCDWSLHLFRGLSGVQVSYVVAHKYAVYESREHNTIGTTININPFATDGSGFKWVDLYRGMSINLRKLVCMLKRDVPRKLALAR